MDLKEGHSWYVCCGIFIPTHTDLKSPYKVYICEKVPLNSVTDSCRMPLHLLSGTRLRSGRISSGSTLTVCQSSRYIKPESSPTLRSAPLPVKCYLEPACCSPRELKSLLTAVYRVGKIWFNHSNFSLWP